MAVPAGVVNDQGHDNDAAFAAIVAGFPAEVQHPARAIRALVDDVLPATVEVVWPKQGSVGWGTGQKKFTEQFAYLMPFKGHVTLGFYRGGELPDPHELLPAEGGKQVGGTLSMRSLRITSESQLREPALRALVETATRTGIPPPRA